MLQKILSTLLETTPLSFTIFYDDETDVTYICADSSENSDFYWMYSITEQDSSTPVVVEEEWKIIIPSSQFSSLNYELVETMVYNYRTKLTVSKVTRNYVERLLFKSE